MIIRAIQPRPEFAVRLFPESCSFDASFYAPSRLVGLGFFLEMEALETGRASESHE
jgi:hypothetical protein